MSNEWLLGYVPGVHGEYFDVHHDAAHRAAKLIPAGSDLVFEMHYTPNGKTAGAGSDQGRLRAGKRAARASAADSSGGEHGLRDSSR